MFPLTSRRQCFEYQSWEENEGDIRVKSQGVVLRDGDYPFEDVVEVKEDNFSALGREGRFVDLHVKFWQLEQEPIKGVEG